MGTADLYENDIRLLAAQSYSSSEIAEKLYLTRNQVIGICYRRKIPLLCRSHRKKPEVSTWQMLPKKQKNMGNLPRLDFRELVPKNSARSDNGFINKINHKSKKINKPCGLLGSEALYAGQQMPLAATRNAYGECRWPGGDKSQLCCGKASGDRPYCEEHASIAYQSVPKQRSIWRGVPVVERVE